MLLLFTKYSVNPLFCLDSPSQPSALHPSGSQRIGFGFPYINRCRPVEMSFKKNHWFSANINLLENILTNIICRLFLLKIFSLHFQCDILLHFLKSCIELSFTTALFLGYVIRFLYEA